MLWRRSRVTPAPGWVEPCIPTVAKVAPNGHRWIYEIKHDGYRLLVRRSDDRVRVYSRNGADWSARYPRIVEAVRRLKARSFLLDGECVVCGPDGMSDFDRLHSRIADHEAVLQAFDLLELDGEEVKREPLVDRKARLERLLGKPIDGILFNEHIAAEGDVVFRAACRLGLEGIVAKRLDMPYRHGRAKCWIKIKNPKSSAMLRVQAEDQ